MLAAVCGKGRMGSLIASELEEKGWQTVTGDALDPALFTENVDSIDLVIDFSHPNNLAFLIDLFKGRPIPFVLGTTGYTPEQKDQIAKEAKTRPVFFASNYSLGVACMHVLVAQAAQILKNWDIEIIETHHNQKADAPSGTALSLLETLDPDGDYAHVFGREGKPGARQKEIGIHAVRGGTVAGEHDVRFFGNQEEIEIVHKAQDRQIFVHGAVQAAEFMKDKPAGLYAMNDLITGEKK